MKEDPPTDITAGMDYRVGLVVASLLSACSALEGAPCGGSIGSCVDRDESLFCLDGRLTRIRCDGPRGCTERSAQLFCDQSVAVVGARCAQEAGAACTPDGASLLTCTGGRYARSGVCRGPGGCRQEGGQVLCDVSRAEVGDACATEETAACTMRGDAWLRCRGGHFELRSPCRGGEGCHVEGARVRCDQSLAEPGDACTDEDTAACTTDRGAMVRCRNGVQEGPVPCRGRRGCRVEGTQVLCDHSSGRQGEPCAPDESWACDVGGARTLVCRAGSFRPGAACPRSCVAEDGQVACR